MDATVLTLDVTVFADAEVTVFWQLAAPACGHLLHRPCAEAHLWRKGSVRALETQIDIVCE